MKNLIKNIFRYSNKNKASILGLFILFFIAVFCVLTLSLLSNNFNRTYNKIVNDSNLQNIVLNESFSNNIEGEKKKKEFLEILNAPKNELINNYNGQGVQAREFESLNISTAINSYKVINYSEKYKISKMFYFDTGGVKNFEMPSYIDFSKIINTAGLDFQQNINNIDKNEIIKARQDIVYFASKSHWSDNNIKEQFILAYEKINEDKNIDPINSQIPEIKKISDEYLQMWLDPKNKNYSPLVTKGYRILFPVENKLIPQLGYYDDIFSFITVVSPEFLKNNNKEVFSLNEFKKLTNTENGLNISSIDNEQFNNGWDKTGWKGINNIDDKYFITIDSLKYLIVASGITPDFLYPIISFDNLIVDFSTEAILYVNNSGFRRTKNSWETAPSENLILVKYNQDSVSIKQKINELNELAHKFMSFPDDFQIAYQYNDDSNAFSPTALRVNFITDLVLTLNVISFILAIFLIIISLFVLAFILDKFIKENRNNFYILIANGFDKWKSIFTLMFIPLIPLFFASLFGYICAWFVQPKSFSLFSKYWGIPTSFSLFNPGWPLLVFFVLMLISSLIIAILGFLRLNGTVSNGIREKSIKVSFLSKIIKIPFNNMISIVSRFRLSLAFSSISKILFSTLISFLLTTSLVFLGSSNSDFTNSINNTKEVNSFSNRIELNTPTRTGGQYFSTNFSNMGKLLYLDDNNTNVPLNPSFYEHEGSYKNIYATNKNFKEWSQLLWSSSNDKGYKETKLDYLYNKTVMQPIMNIDFGLGSLSSNPWFDLTIPFLPFNQANASNILNSDLFTYLYNDFYVLNNPDLLKKNNTWLKTNKLFLTKNKIKYYLDDSNLLPILDISRIKEFEELNDITSLNNYFDIIKANFPNNFNQNSVVSNIKNVGFGYILELTQNTFEYMSNHTYIMNFYSIVKSDLNNNQKYIKTYDSILKKDIYLELNKKNSLELFNTKLNEKFINYWISVFSDPQTQKFLYKITYNQVPINNVDEKYVYINAELWNTRIKSRYKFKNDIKIIGVEQNSKYIHLLTNNNENISHKLLSKPNSSYPLLINEYAAKEYDLKEGDVLTILPKNHVDRFHVDFKSNPLNFIQSFVVVGIVKSTKGSQFFTDIDLARNVIGLATNEDFKNNIEPQSNLEYPFPNALKKLNNQYNSGGFNGIFVSNDIPALTNNVGLYSNMGFYPGIEAIQQSSSLELLFRNNLFPKNSIIDFNTNINFQLISNALFLKTNELDDFIQEINNVKNNESAQNLLISKLITRFNTIYGNHIYNSSINSVEPQDILLESFRSVINTIDQIKSIVISLLIILTLIMLLFISWILINEMKLLFILLKTQGYSDLSNLISAFSIFVPIWILSSLLTIPSALISLFLFNEFIFLKMGILLNSAINWGFFFLAIFSLLFLLLFIMGINYFKLKKENLVTALKW